MTGTLFLALDQACFITVEQKPQMSLSLLPSSLTTGDHAFLLSFPYSSLFSKCIVFAYLLMTSLLPEYKSHESQDLV